MAIGSVHYTPEQAQGQAERTDPRPGCADAEWLTDTGAGCHRRAQEVSVSLVDEWCEIRDCRITVIRRPWS